MSTSMAGKIAKLYSDRHGEQRREVFGDKPYANLGYWDAGQTDMAAACDALTDLTARAAGMKEGDRVLEVGCGYGASAVTYAKRYRPARVVGIDITDVRIEDARRYVAQEGFSATIELGLGDATALRFEDGSFDCVIAIECAFHFETRLDFFHEAARVLVPGGGLGMTDLVPRDGLDPEEFLERVHFPIGTDQRLDVTENVYDAPTYARRLAEAGFEEVRVESITRNTLVPFADHLERVGRRSEEERKRRRLRVAEAYRQSISDGLEYVLVSARKREA